MGTKKELEVTITVSETEYRALEIVYKKYGLGTNLTGWRPSGDLMVVKKVVETIRGGKG